VFPHFVAPESQAHLPAAQCVSPWHGLLQPPQFESSVLVSTHELPHAVSEAAHFDTHLPCEQSCPVAQGPPQLPQFRASAIVFEQVAPHWVCPEGQLHSPE
jgi:hypothetical protein